MKSPEIIGLFGVRSPLAVEYEETCLRADIAIVFGVSVSGTPRLMNIRKIYDILELDSVSRDIPVHSCAFSPARRKALMLQAIAHGFQIAGPLIDPTAIIPQSLSVGPGSFINAGAVIGGVSKVGSGVLINRSVSVGHHVFIGDYVSIGPGATLAGNIRVGEGSMIGAGAIVQPDVRIGENAVIAAGSVVRKHVSDGAMVAGNPAKQYKFKPVHSTLNIDDGE